MRISTEVERATLWQFPGCRTLLGIASKLALDPTLQGRGVPVRITYSTSASPKKVQGRLHLCVVPSDDNGQYYAGIFQGQLVEGNVNLRTGRGDMQSL